MVALTLTYYFASLVLVASALAAPLFLHRDETGPLDSAYRVCLAALSVTGLGMAYNQAVWIIGGAVPEAAQALSLFSLLGLVCSELAFPWFASRAAGRRFPPYIFILCACSLTAAVFLAFHPGGDSLNSLLVAAVILPFAWTIGYSTYYLVRSRKRSMSPVWKKLIRKLMLCAVVMGPFVIMNDFFHVFRTWLQLQIPDLMPLFLGILSVFYLQLSAERRSAGNAEPAEEGAATGGTGTNGAAAAAAGTTGTVAAPGAAPGSVHGFDPPGTGAALPSEPELVERGLTVREAQVALLVLEGYTYRGAAERLGIGLSTVKTHLLRVYDKTGAGNKMELFNFLRRG